MTDTRSSRMNHLSTPICEQGRLPHPSAGDGPVAALWLAAAVRRWHVPVLYGDDSALPYLALEGDEPVALIFTTRRRANRAVDGWIADVVGRPVGTASISPETAMEVLGRLCARGVQWVRIDHGPDSVRLPLEPLVGALQRQWESDSGLDDASLAFAWLVRQERVLMLSDPVAGDLPFVEIIDESPSIRIFASRSRAWAHAPEIHASDRDSRTISLSGANAIDCLQRLAILGVDHLIIEQLGGTRTVRLATLLDQSRRAA